MRPRRHTHRSIQLRLPEMLLCMGILLLSSCAAAPFLIPAGIEFARNLLVTSNKNYGGKYSEDMNRLMMRLSTPYVAMGLPAGTPNTALIPPAIIQQQQQQALMNQQVGVAAGQFGQGGQGQPGMGMSGAVPMDPYATGQVGGVPGQNMGFGQQPGMSMGGMQGGQFGMQGQQQGFYDPNNPYSPGGMNVQGQVYGTQQFGNQFGGQYGQVGAQPYGQPQPGVFQQQGYQPQGAPLQPGYPAAALGSQAPMPGYQQPMQGYGQQMQGYGQQPGMQMQQGQMYPQPGMDIPATSHAGRTTAVSATDGPGVPAAEYARHATLSATGRGSTLRISRRAERGGRLSRSGLPSLGGRTC